MEYIRIFKDYVPSLMMIGGFMALEVIAFKVAMCLLTIFIGYVLYRKWE